MNDESPEIGVVTQEGNIRSGNTGRITFDASVTSTTYPELRDGTSAAGIAVLVLVAVMLWAVLTRGRRR